MKKILLALLLLVSSAAVKAQGIFENINIAESFFSQLDSGHYNVAYSFFDDTVKTKIKPENLQNLWKNLENALGKFQAVDGVQNKIQDEFQLVVVNLKFEKDNQPMQLTFNQKNQIAGLFILPKQQEQAYKLPIYADTASYIQKLVTIHSGKFELPAMLTLPKDSINCPIVVFVHGSGPSDMDETLGPNKPFKDIALGLASNGIASLRYVKRTLIYPNAFSGAFTVKDEVLDDASMAIKYAKSVSEVDSQKVYVFGHSLGGMLAPRIVTLNPSIKGIILAAAPARKLQDLIIEQSNFFFNLEKDTTKAGKAALAESIKALNATKTLNAKTAVQDSAYFGLPVSYWADLNAMDQTAIARKLNQRIFVIQGGHDFQVSTADLELWRKALKSKKNVDSKLYPMLNHLLQFVSSKDDNIQYAVPLSVDETVVNDLASWIKQ